MRKTFQYKLYRAKRNKYLHAQIDVAAWIYNHCIALHKRYYRLFGKSLNKFALQKHLTKLKQHKKFSSWKKLGSQAIQDITERIDRAYQLFFKSLKSKRKVSPPNFRKRVKYKSFTLKQAGYKVLDENKLKIGKQIFKYHKSRDVVGKIKTVTIKRDCLGDLYVFFSCEVENSQERVMTGKIAGFDFGLKTFLMPSDCSEPIQSPLFFKNGALEVRNANKNLSSKKKGSNHRKQARQNLARVHAKVANRRKDFHFKLARKLAIQYDILCFEDLNIKAMQMMWGRKISDLGFSSFIEILKYQCEKYKSKIVFVDRFFPSSKTCSDCGYINKELQLKDRSWTCRNCGCVHDRDRNAAINICREGASSLGLGDVSLEFQAISA